MCNRVDFSFRIKDKGGVSGGKNISASVPDFDWERFKNTPNAETFVKKAYFAALKKIMREVEERKNGSLKSDLDSIEAVITRTLAFTQEDIRNWIETRDWSKVLQVQDNAELMDLIKKQLPKLASRQNPFSANDSEKLAYKVISAVADVPQDPIADFLNTTLTTRREDDIQLEELY